MLKSEIPEQFSRTVLVFGEEPLRRLRQARITVVGLGGVGSYALEILARMGAGSLRLVDFDKVQPSNINRQLLALHSTVGQSKTDIARQRVLDINPDCQVEVLECRADATTLPRILDNHPAVVIDAIDSIDAKVELLTAACQRQLPIVSCMGAARRLDPTRLRVASIAETQTCPLAREVRVRLRERKIGLGIPCVFSTEPPLKATNIESTESKSDPVCSRPCSRAILGSVPTVTGTAGLLLAHVAIQTLLKPVSEKIE